MPNDIRDINDFSGRLRSQLDLVKDLEPREDSNAILEWAHSMTVAKTTKIDRIKNVRLIAERADRPLVEFDSAADVLRLLDDFRTGEHPDVSDSGLAEGTLRQYRQAARLFFRDGLDRDWGGDIDIGQPEPTPITPDQILTSREVDQLLDACEHPRDAALISFLTVTGQRITAALSIVLGDVELGERSGQIRLNDDAEGLKGASGPRPLLWSRPYVATWVQNHPRQGDPDAPLFCTKQGGQRPHEDGHMVEWSKGDPISRSQIHNDLVSVAKRAGVDPEKVKPHNFRHTAITRMRDQGIADDRIRFMVGVAEDSDILERYDQATDEKMMARLREQYGIEPADDDRSAIGQPTMKDCPQCKAPLRGGTRFCPQCGVPLDADAADTVEDSQQAVADDMIELEDPEKRALARDSLDDLMSDPEFRDDLADFLTDRV